MGSNISNFTRKSLCSIFRYGGQLPKSIAIIMDGNRRYATKKNVERIKGHEDGLSKLLQVLQWCIDLEIKEVTVFAFSIDNFNRSKDEITSILNLAKEKFTKLSEKNEYLNKYGVKVCFYGNLNYFDEELKKDLHKMELETELNNKLKLNVCFSYNSTEEICSTLKRINQIDENIPLNLKKRESNYNYLEIFDSNLYGGYNCNPEILIRTSGEIRLSNFLLYQCRFSMIFFLDVYWPEFSFADFVKILFRFNINYKTHIRKLKELESENNFKIIQ